MKIRVGVSNRHIHLCKMDADVLFGNDYEFKKRNDLTQTGEYACEEVVKVSTDKYEFPYVRVLGPLRVYTQVEVSRDDSDKLGINPLVRDSGDLEDSESVWLEGPNGKIFKKNCCIIANNHIHANNDELKEFSNNDIVSVKTKDGIIIEDVHIKKDDSFVLEMHIDTYNSKLYNLVTNDIVVLEKR